MAVRRVLVVDDEELIRWSISERLRSDGHDVVEAGTAAEALEKAQIGVDLVLLDYKLPDEDGFPSSARSGSSIPTRSSSCSPPTRVSRRSSSR